MMDNNGNLIADPTHPGFVRAVREMMQDFKLGYQEAEHMAMLLFDQFPENLMDGYSTIELRGDEIRLVAISARNGMRRSFVGEPEYALTMAEGWLRTIRPTPRGIDKQLRRAESCSKRREEW